MDIIHFIYSVVIFSIVCLVDINCEDVDIIQSTLPKNSSKSHEPRIIGGERAALGEFKGVISIKTSESSRHICGGTLISPSVILTAAHCVMSRKGRVVSSKSLIVMGDDLKIREIDASRRRQYRRISSILVHPGYDHYAHVPKDDIALIAVASPFVLTPTFSPANVTNSTASDNELCRIAGWGLIDPRSEAVSDELMTVNVTVVPTWICNGTLSYNGLIRNNTICAGYMDGGRDSCQGDSGGALFCGDVVKGIVSWGRGCGEPYYPGVYTSTYHYKEWIEENFLINSSANSVTSMLTISALTILFFVITKMREISCN